MKPAKKAKKVFVYKDVDTGEKFTSRVIPEALEIGHVEIWEDVYGIRQVQYMGVQDEQ